MFAHFSDTLRLLRCLYAILFKLFEILLAVLDVVVVGLFDNILLLAGCSLASITFKPNTGQIMRLLWLLFYAFSQLLTVALTWIYCKKLSLSA